MDRRAPALTALLLFAVATVLATVLDGRLPASEESVVGWVVQVLGHLAGITAGVLLLTTTTAAPGRSAGSVVLAAMVVLVLVDAVALAGDGGGGDVALGGVRLLALLAVGAVALRLAPAVARERRPEPPGARR